MKQQVIESEGQPEARLHDAYVAKCSLLGVPVQYPTSSPPELYSRDALELVAWSPPVCLSLYMRVPSILAVGYFVRAKDYSVELRRRLRKRIGLLFELS